MKLLTLGCSSIARRRAFPGLLALPEIESIDIASRRPVPEDLLPEDRRGKVFTSYEAALETSDAELVYVSLVNSLHRPMVEAALRSGRHVVVDKPAFMTLADTEKMLALADARDLLLAEAIVFADHPAFRLVEQIAHDNGGATRIQTAFSFPPPEDGNFRYSRELGGGAVNDIAPYPVAVGRHLFRDMPVSVSCRPLGWRDGVDISALITMTWQDGRALSAFIGYDTEYRNMLSVFGPGMSVDLDRAYTPQPGTMSELRVRIADRPSVAVAEAGDNFSGFFARVLACLGDGRHGELMEAMRHDALVMDMLRLDMGFMA
jgi:predicted dehydrogenase